MTNLRHLHECRTIIACNNIEKNCEQLASVCREKLSYIRATNTVKLVSHWHANFSRLFCEFCRGLSHDTRATLRTTFLRVSRECRENFLVSRTSRELVAKFFNMLKNFMRIFSPKYFARLSRDSRATVARRSCECRELVAAKFWRIYNAKFSRHSYECRASVARRSRDSLAKTSRLSGEKMKLSNIRTNVARLSYEFK